MVVGGCSNASLRQDVVVVVRFDWRERTEKLSVVVVDGCLLHFLTCEHSSSYTAAADVPISQMQARLLAFERAST